MHYIIIRVHSGFSLVEDCDLLEDRGYLESMDNISGKHGQHGHGQHAKSNPNCNPNPNPDYYFT